MEENYSRHTRYLLIITYRQVLYLNNNCFGRERATILCNFILTSVFLVCKYAYLGVGKDAQLNTTKIAKVRQLSAMTVLFTSITSEGDITPGQ